MNHQSTYAHYAVALAAVLCALFAVLSAPARAHETDQFSVPTGKTFAALDDYISDIAFDALTVGMEKTNDKIRAALARHASRAEIDKLYEPDVIANDVYTSFPNAVVLIEEIENYVSRSSTKKLFPGRIVGYQEFSYIYDNNFFPLDPRQVFKIWRASTIKVNGVYLGTDKIGHFTDMGMNYYKKFRAALKDGKSEEEAMAIVRDFAANDGFLGEKGVIGFVSSGVYSNADLASNYSGLKFYINLTKPTLIRGEVRSPMLVRDGDLYALAPYVTRDSSFFLDFITDHFDEALNPSLHVKGVRDAVRKAVEQRADHVRAWYADVNGMERTPEYFDDRVEELRTYYGENYGWWAGDENEILLTSQMIFPPMHTQLAPTSNDVVQLMQAAYDGDPELVRIALADGADANAHLSPPSPLSSDAGNTPLHMAARRGASDTIHLLLEAGADARAANLRMVTPLHMAAHEPEAARRLIEAGAPVDAADLAGRSPLHWAANNPSDPVAEMLIEHGADVDQRDKHGQTPLHLAASQGNIDVMNTLLEHGADANAKARYNTTPLHMAAAHDRVDAVTLLLRNGADANAKDEYGCTPLHDAARLGHIETVRALLANRAQANAVDAYGTTPLHLAARFNRPTVITLLLDHGADMEAGNDFGMSPVEEARRKGNKDALAIFTARSKK